MERKSSILAVLEIYTDSERTNISETSSVVITSALNGLRYLKGGTRWHYQYVVDSAAQELINLYGIDPSNIESALDLADDYKRRIKFQADVQDYVDMSISSTINLPAWGSKLNNEDTVDDFTNTLASYASRLRGFTVYPDASRGGQPLTSVPYSEAVDKLGEEFEEGVETHDICDITGHGGSCGV